jgi:hypothetical protein
MFDRSTIERALTRVGLALNRTLVATQRERDQAIQERDQAVAERKAVEGGSLTSSQRPSLLPKRNAMPSERSGIRHTARLMVFAENAMN